MPDNSDAPPTPAEAELAEAIRRRRTFAIISHPDAGKTTLTEKLLLYGGAIHLAGAVKARRAPLPMCQSEISRCYEHRSDELGCRNPEFHETPRPAPSFRVFAVI